MSQTKGEKDSCRKLFVGGLAQHTTTKTFIEYFSKFGEVSEADVVIDGATQKSRCFGFVKFKNTESATKVFQERTHYLDSKKIDPKPCEVNNSSTQYRFNKENASKDNLNLKCKIFIGGIPRGITDAQLKEYFSKFGKISNLLMVVHRETQRPRGFGFVTFQSEEDVLRVLKEQYHTIGEHTLEVKECEPRGAMYFDQRNSRYSRNSDTVNNVEFGVRMISLNSDATIENESVEHSPYAESNEKNSVASPLVPPVVVNSDKDNQVKHQMVYSPYAIYTQGLNSTGFIHASHFPHPVIPVPTSVQVTNSSEPRSTVKQSSENYNPSVYPQFAQVPVSFISPRAPVPVQVQFLPTAQPLAAAYPGIPHQPILNGYPYVINPITGCPHY